MLNPAEINITKLTEVMNIIINHEKLKLNRGEGCTTAYLHLMLNEAETVADVQNYVYIGPNPYNTMLDFITLLEYEHIKYNFNRVTHTVQANNCNFMFTNKKRACDDNFWRGLQIEKVFLDDDTMSPRTPYFDYKLSTNIYPTGATII